jgi:hypothetical protein
MSLIVPTWFKQRQGKAEPAGTDTYRLTAPNLAESFIQIRQAENGRWAAVLRQTADGPELAATETVFERPDEAWEAAFELHRTRVVV